MAKKQKQAFVVTVSGEHGIEKVARALKAKGFEVDQILDAIGVVTGSALPGDVAEMRKIPGVKDVSADHRVDIGPPGAPIS
jgi:hypothetical protein